MKDIISYNSKRRGNYVNPIDRNMPIKQMQMQQHVQDNAQYRPPNYSQNAQVPFADLKYKLSKVKLKIVRETNTIPLPLPYVLWCPTSIDDNYMNIFQRAGVVPAGGTAVVSTVGPDLTIDWTVAGNTDRIRISCTGLVPYTQRLQMIDTGGWFTATGFRYFFQQANNIDQLSSYDYFTVENGFSSIALADSEDMLSLIGPTNFQTFVVDFVKNIWINPERGEILGFANAPAITPYVTSVVYFDLLYKGLSDQAREGWS